MTYKQRKWIQESKPNRWIAGGEQAKTSSLEILPSSKTVNLTENDDTGNNKNIKEEDDPHKAWRQENNDKKSKEVIERVKLLKVHDTIMNPDKPKTHSPFSDFVNVRTSFDWTAK